MRESLEYTAVPGTKTDKKVTVFALSTCGFCKRGIEFLKESSVAFNFVYIDFLPLDTKRDLKDELLEVSGKRVAFPFLVIDNVNFIVGFVEDEWKEALGL